MNTQSQGQAAAPAGIELIPASGGTIGPLPWIGHAYWFQVFTRLSSPVRLPISTGFPPVWQISRHTLGGSLACSCSVDWRTRPPFELQDCRLRQWQRRYDLRLRQDTLLCRAGNRCRDCMVIIRPAAELRAVLSVGPALCAHPVGGHTLVIRCRKGDTDPDG